MWYIWYLLLILNHDFKEKKWKINLIKCIKYMNTPEVREHGETKQVLTWKSQAFCLVWILFEGLCMLSEKENNHLCHPFVKGKKYLMTGLAKHSQKYYSERWLFAWIYFLFYKIKLILGTIISCLWNLFLVLLQS